ncbi:MAG TPA: TIM barrel protein [Acidisarcina sp.]
MIELTRRQFLERSLPAAALSLSAFALGVPRRRLPLGLQLYSVRQMLALDFEQTLRQIGELGYREVEAAGFYGRSATQVASAMRSAGLACVSAHYTFDQLATTLDQIIDFGNQLGLRYIICSFPGFRDPGRVQGKSYQEKVASFTLEDLCWSAHKFNDFGRKVHAAGMQFGYHNHTMEFASQDGEVPYDSMIRIADPQLVTFEMDCGWVIIGGGDPVSYLRRYPHRISLLHVKDFKGQRKPFTITDSPDAAELGRGIIPNEQILIAARAAHVHHCFVEQEEYDMPPLEALKLDAEFMHDHSL